MSDLIRVAQLALLMKKQKKAVEDAETALKKARADHERTERDTLPALMAEVGLSSVTLDDGSVVKIQQDCHAHISRERAEAAHAWLLDHGFGGLLKTRVAVEFGRGELDEADTLAAQLAADHYDVAASASVHHSTLKAFVNEQLREGNPLPLELFGVHPFTRAVLK